MIQVTPADGFRLFLWLNGFVVDQFLYLHYLVVPALYVQRYYGNTGQVFQEDSAEGALDYCALYTCCYSGDARPIWAFAYRCTINEQ
jgi:hypothetical protein